MWTGKCYSLNGAEETHQEIILSLFVFWSVQIVKRLFWGNLGETNMYKALNGIKELLLILLGVLIGTIVNFKKSLEIHYR